MESWDPSKYLQFDDLRSRPARDLLARVQMDRPDTVVDVGCGPGNSTILLRERWPEATIVGIDSSPEMIDAAMAASVDAAFAVADLWAWSPVEPLDVVFSNAVLQWVPDHAAALARLISWIRPGGVLAVQMPANFDAPSHVAITKLARSSRWSDRLADAVREVPVRPPGGYASMLAAPGRHLDIWTTEYLQLLAGEDPIVEWVMGTWLRPFVDRLEGSDRDDFLAEYSSVMTEAYPRQSDDSTIFPFKRLFVVVHFDETADTLVFGSPNG